MLTLSHCVLMNLRRESFSLKHNTCSDTSRLPLQVSQMTSYFISDGVDSDRPGGGGGESVEMLGEAGEDREMTRTHVNTTLL